MKSIAAYIDELKGLDRHNVGSWPTYAYVLVIGLVAALMAGGAYWYVVKPDQKTLAAARRDEARLRHTFREKHEKVAHLDEYKTQLADLKDELAGLLSELPSKSEVPKLLRDVSQTRAANGLTELLFKPQSNDPHEFYVTLPNKLVVNGSFHDLAEFVSDVAALSRIVTVDSVAIRPLDENAGTLQMNATLKTYRYLGGDGAS